MRENIAKELYINKGSKDGRRRCDINTNYGSVDLASILMTELSLAAGDTMLDICCGSGAHLKKFTTRVGNNGLAIGIDFSYAAAQDAKKLGLSVLVADGGAIPFTDNSFDCICCNYGIYYLDDIEDALNDWFRVIKSGGNLVISGPSQETNKELYAFHYLATGRHPEQADTMALGYVENQIKDILLNKTTNELEVITLVNPVTFKSPGQFLDYWTSTTLFLRCKDITREHGDEVVKNLSWPFVINKKTSILKTTVIGNKN